MSSTIGKVIQCKAAVLYEFEKQLKILKILVAPPKGNEVRIQMFASGISHTDDLALSGGMANMKFPVILGSGGTGTVESVGEGVTKVQPGDHVLVSCSPMCMKCKACLHENSNFCEKNDFGKNKGVMNDGTTRFSIDGKPIHNFMSCSTFAEYTVVDQMACMKIDPKANMEEVSLIAGEFSTGYGAVMNTAKVQRDRDCIIFGLGGIGEAVVIAAEAAGASRIIVVDTNSAKFPIAKQLGATHVLNPKDYDEPIHDVLSKMTDGGADYAFECSGKPEVMESAIKSTHPSYGSVNFIGVPKSTDRLKLDLMLLLTGRILNGSFLGDFKPNIDLLDLVNYAINKKFDLSKMADRKMDFNKINEGFDTMRQGKCISCILLMDQSGKN